MCRYWPFRISDTGFFLLFCVGVYYQNSLSLTIVLYTIIVSLYIILFNIQMHKFDNLNGIYTHFECNVSSSYYFCYVLCIPKWFCVIRIEMWTALKILLRVKLHTISLINQELLESGSSAIFLNVCNSCTDVL